VSLGLGGVCILVGRSFSLGVMLTVVRAAMCRIIVSSSYFFVVIELISVFISLQA